MYLVMTLKTRIETNAFPVNLDRDRLAGMVPVFKRKRDAIACAKKNNNTQVLKIAITEEPTHET